MDVGEDMDYVWKRIQQPLLKFEGILDPSRETPVINYEMRYLMKSEN